tara:strand:+ start:630 stop:1142 length:513 start_codon:yes stop_codon:yes gene_type:complete
MGAPLVSSFKRVIRVTPTLSTDAYASGDVLFTATEIPGAVGSKGGCSKLVGMYVLDTVSQTADINFVFSEGNTALGTINATANISDGDIVANNVLGFARLDDDQAATAGHIDNSQIHQVLPASGVAEDSNTTMLLQAASGSTSVYVQGLITSGTPTYAADSLTLIFHIEY